MARDRFHESQRSIDAIKIYSLAYVIVPNDAFHELQSGLSSRAKHGGTVFSAVSGSIKDLTTVPGFCNHLGPPNLINFAPALVFLSVLNIYSFAIEFGGCICYFWSKWISWAKSLTFPGAVRFGQILVVLGRNLPIEPQVLESVQPFIGFRS